jgi:hypothetical protein
MSKIDLYFYEKKLREKYGNNTIDRFKKIISEIRDMSETDLFEECKWLCSKN